MIKRYAIFAACFIAFQCFVGIARASDSLEQQLATINAQGYVPKDHITVTRFRRLLDNLSSSFVEDRQQIADMSAKAYQILKEEEGIDEKLINIMEGMYKISQLNHHDNKYANCIALYLYLRSKGNSHSDSIIGIQSMSQ